MSLPTSNPFILKKYYIHESAIGASNKSAITENTSPPPGLMTYMKPLGPYDLREVIEYLSLEIRKFNKLFVFAKNCNEIAQSLMIKDGKYKEMDKDCRSRFKAFNNDTTLKALSNLQTQDMTTWPKTSIDGTDVKSFIGSVGKGMFTELHYNPAYIASQKDDNSKKEMDQRLEDLTNMLKNMEEILGKISRDQNIIQNYPDRYEEIKTSYANINNLRNELNTKLRELNSGKDTKFGNSKLYLDSTVYTSVLWTILATSVLFYVFKRL